MQFGGILVMINMSLPWLHMAVAGISTYLFLEWVEKKYGLDAARNLALSIIVGGSIILAVTARYGQTMGW